MSDLNIEQLQAELVTLRQESVNLKNGINFLQAQLDAYKEFINELLASSIQLRTNLCMSNKHSLDKDNIIKQKDLLIAEKDIKIASLTPKIE